MKELGQSPIHVKKEVNGFVVNRLQYALIMEAWRLVSVRKICMCRIATCCYFTRLYSLKIRI